LGKPASVTVSCVEELSPALLKAKATMGKRESRVPEIEPLGFSVRLRVP